uniref:RING-type E3 ubiquitin transferase n=1 Tax=Meleagris gallopavo TaxID=9103 RepID=A0A803YHW2_MELGA
MATELDRRCPICLDTMDDASYVMPCLHQFCFGCIQRWAENRPTCPLCKRRMGPPMLPQDGRAAQQLHVVQLPMVHRLPTLAQSPPAA